MDASQERVGQCVLVSSDAQTMTTTVVRRSGMLLTQQGLRHANPSL
jgi:hypothetical protein